MVVEIILAYIRENDLGGLVWACVKSGLLGAVLGLVAGVMAFVLIRRLKAYALDGRGGKWARAIV